MKDFHLSESLAFLQDAQEGTPRRGPLVLGILTHIQKLLEAIDRATLIYGQKLFIEKSAEGECSTPILSHSLEKIRDFYQDKGFHFHLEDFYLCLEDLKINMGELYYCPSIEAQHGFTRIFYNIFPFNCQEGDDQFSRCIAPEGPQFLIKMAEPQSSPSELSRKKTCCLPPEAK